MWYQWKLSKTLHYFYEPKWLLIIQFQLFSEDSVPNRKFLEISKYKYPNSLIGMYQEFV